MLVMFGHREIYVKAADKMLLKLTSVVNLTNILQLPFCLKVFCTVFITKQLGFCNSFWKRILLLKLSFKGRLGCW